MADRRIFIRGRAPIVRIFPFVVVVAALHSKCKVWNTRPILISYTFGKLLILAFRIWNLLSNNYKGWHPFIDFEGPGFGFVNPIGFGFVIYQKLRLCLCHNPWFFTNSMASASQPRLWLSNLKRLMASAFASASDIENALASWRPSFSSCLYPTILKKIS